MSNLLLSLFAFVAYVLLASYFWRATACGECDARCRGTVGHLSLVPIAAHGYLLWQGIFAGGGIDLGIFNALSLIMWLTLLVYWVARFFYPIGSLQAIVLPLAAVTLLLPGVFPVDHQLPHVNLLAFKVHIAVAMLAYSLFTIAVLHAVLISLVEKRLHQATMPRLLRRWHDKALPEGSSGRRQKDREAAARIAAGGAMNQADIDLVMNSAQTMVAI